MAALRNKYIKNERGQYNDQESERVETTTNKDNYNFNCDICTKEFKSISNLNNHDRKYHIVKGKNIYKCDNCNDKHDDKVKLKCLCNMSENISNNIFIEYSYYSSA